jgi:hypothetical protein
VENNSVKHALLAVVMGTTCVVIGFPGLMVTLTGRDLETKSASAAARFLAIPFFSVGVGGISYIERRDTTALVRRDVESHSRSG